MFWCWSAVERCGSVLGLALLGLVGGVSLPAQHEVEWRTDFDAARQTAQLENKLLFVVVHQAGEPGNDGMVRTVYGHRRLARALDGVVAALSVHAPLGLEREAADAFRVDDLASLAVGERQAREFLFGDQPVITPQQMIFHPDGDLLWHNVRVCSLQRVLSGIDRAKRLMPKKVAHRRRLAVRDGAELARRADRDPEHYAKLVALARHSSVEQLWAILERVDHRKPLCQRVLRDSMSGLESGCWRLRLEHGRSGKHAEAVVNVIEELSPAASLPAPVEVITSLPVLGQVELSEALFGDEQHPSFADASAGITVVWLFLADDKTTQGQIAALRPVVEELTARGVKFLGLAGSLRPEDALGPAQELGFPFSVGALRHDSTAPFGGVSLFPAALIVDRHGGIVYRTPEDSDALADSYTEFAPWARGILRYLDA